VAKIVVGVDASPGALQALAWAADEARLRLASLQVVHAYHAQALAAPLYFPSEEGLPGQAMAAGARPPQEETTEAQEHQTRFQEAVRRQAEDLLAGLLDQVAENRVIQTYMALADQFQEIVDSLPSDWTDLELDLRVRRLLADLQ
jgi:nucleotide-binding universal stress UspA family protein